MITAKSGISVAASAALFALAAMTPAAPAFAKGQVAQVHCFGVNSCKGTSDCKTAHNSCKGMNECKGHGFKTMSKQQCAAAGGSLTEM
ncbi:BufA2 family periplasmic bufferin-type metallophore [Sphingomonas sp. RB1R13]|uniref:BufA2 family periplasmic bufferin-type metallophore n=1 Tax=Sphingomonas sp. RB1R13 TaxID=3096159 RepID=UPI002FC5F11D